jgi:hypothetical protein
VPWSSRVDGGLAARCSTDDVDVREGVEQPGEAVAEHLVVVDDDDPQRLLVAGHGAVRR